jgi:RNA polymerase sigma factor (sigma-70 family)
LNDNDLIKGCLQDDRKSQKFLYEKYGPTLYGIAARYGKDEANSKDILQESFIKIFKSLGDFGHNGSFEGWLKRITVNTALNYVKTSQFKLFNYSVDVEHANLSKYDVIIDDMGVEDLMKVINKLPLGYKTVFNMNIIDGYNHSEIAEILGTTESNSRSQLSKAKQKLVEMLNESGILRHA